ncbi:MAG TPA: serine/threonine-protein kinase, partial [Gemmataceae bacterium]|nr:serine/threonine-protein kinase [Gemmataceae bacterium]
MSASPVDVTLPNLFLEVNGPPVPVGGEPETAILGPINGRYDLGAKIARGGMGVVYRAHDRLLNRTVAVKVMRGKFLSRPDLMRRFLAEARISARLQHPGIVPVYEVGTLPDGRPFIAMKLIEGETLARLLAARSTPADHLSHFLKVFEALCQAVAYAHEQGVIHRDLKPDNVMVGSFGEVQVMDWGLAKVLGGGGDSEAEIPTLPAPWPTPTSKADFRAADNAPVGEHATHATMIVPVGPEAPDAAQTDAGAVFGTAPFMPPEQARGEIDKLDARGDVFALGAILCQILTGQPRAAFGLLDAGLRFRQPAADLVRNGRQRLGEGIRLVPRDRRLPGRGVAGERPARGPPGRVDVRVRLGQRRLNGSD